MKLFYRTTALLICLSFSSAQAFSQIIWSEDFTYPDSTTAGPAGKWASFCGACLAGDYFWVVSNSFRASDVNDWSVWQSESIDISGCSNVSFSLSASETGDHEGPSCLCLTNQDYFDVYYSISGGPFTVIQNWNGDGEVGHTLTGDSQNGVFTDLDWGSTTISLSGLVGSTLELRIEMRNTAGDEVMILDDLVVNCGPLPVEMTSLRAVPGEGTVEIEWETLLESGSDHFLVERSGDGQAFFSIGKVAAAGNSDHLLNYRFTDGDPISGRAFYRLRQVDQDGSYTLTQVVEVAAHTPGLSITSAYPNPASDHLSIELHSGSETRGNLQVLDLMGKEVFGESLELHPDANALKIPTSGLASGMYILRVSSVGETVTQRFSVR